MRNIKTVTRPYQQGILSQKYDNSVNMTFFLPRRVKAESKNMRHLINEIFMQQSSFILRVSIYFELTNHQRESHEPRQPNSELEQN